MQSAELRIRVGQGIMPRALLPCEYGLYLVYKLMLSHMRCRDRDNVVDVVTELPIAVRVGATYGPADRLMATVR